MKAIIAKLFNRAPVPVPENASKPPAKRRYGAKRAGRGSLPVGARRIDPNGPILAQARGRRHGGY